MPFSQSLWEPTVNHENAMGFWLLNHAGTFGNYNMKVFESTEMRGRLKEEVFQRLDGEIGVLEYLSGFLIARRQLPCCFRGHEPSLDMGCHATWRAVLFLLLYTTDLKKKKKIRKQISLKLR